jgi:ATP-dependent DNA helicase RecG
MWANTLPEGGLIVLGMNNDGSFSGCLTLSSKELNDREKSDAHYCPDSRTESKRIRIVNKKGQNDFVVLFRTFYREDKVVTDVSGNAFIRKGDEKRKLTNAEIRELQIDRREIDFEREPITTLEFPEDFREDLIGKFVEGVHKLRNLQQPHSGEKILEQRRLGRKINGVLCQTMRAYSSSQRTL